jgi:hypothetical protein
MGKSAVRQKSDVQEDVLARIYSVSVVLPGVFHGQVRWCSAFEDLVLEDGARRNIFQWLGL